MKIKVFWHSPKSSKRWSRNSHCHQTDRVHHFRRFWIFLSKLCVLFSVPIQKDVRTSRNGVPSFTKVFKRTPLTARHNFSVRSLRPHRGRLIRFFLTKHLSQPRKRLGHSITSPPARPRACPSTTAPTHRGRSTPPTRRAGDRAPARRRARGPAGRAGRLRTGSPA